MHIDPMHHLHVDKITRGANLHVTPNLRVLHSHQMRMDTYRKTLVTTTSYNNYETCIDEVT